jgi:hypothetical protein
MAITDIISEEVETRAPNLEVARGGPEDFMTDDEMDPYQDPEFQQLLDSLPGEQAEVLMQLIKEFKAMVAQGFRGEFEDFVKMKMASAQGGPEDFMSEEEMQIGPEEQQSLIPMGQQVAQGGRIGYAGGNGVDKITLDFSREMWKKHGKGGQSFNDFLEWYYPSLAGEGKAQGGRIGYQNAGPVGGIMDVVEEEQVPLPDIDTPQQRIMDWLEAHNLPPTPENIQKAIVAMAREGQGPVKGTRFGSHMDIPQMQMPGPPTGEGYVPEELIGQNITETVTPDVAQMNIVDEAVVPQEKPEDYIYSDEEMQEMKNKFLEQGGTFSDPPSEDVEEVGIMQKTDPTFYSDDKITYTEEDAIQWRQQLDRLRETRRGQDPAGYLQLEDSKMKEGVDKGFISEEDYLNKWQMPFFGRRGERKTEEIDRYRDWAGLAQGGRIGYAYGSGVTADAPGIMSQVPDAQAQQIEQSQAYEDAYYKIMRKFSEKFPGVDSSEVRVEDMVAELQAEGVGEHAGGDILSFAAGLDMITPESVRNATQAVSRHGWDYPEWEDEHPFDHPVDEMMGRPGYGLGSLVKDIFKGGKKLVKGLTKSVKKFAKSDLGKMALMYMATAGMGNIGANWGGAKNWGNMMGKQGWLSPSNVMGNLTKSYGNLFSKSPAITEASKAVTGVYPVGTSPTLPAIYQQAKAPATLGSKFLGSFQKNPMPWILGTSGAAGLYTKMNPGEDNLDNLMRNYKDEVKEWDDRIAGIRAGNISTPFSTDNITYPYPDYSQYAAEGGRIGRAEGGLMDLGGMEKDYRAEGGFVPIGKKEKADDVPARLSVNEFVFTADAVRNAGGGDVDRGAEVMENVMTNLEQGGNISEESQGLEGARDMFEVSERLSEVV